MLSIGRFAWLLSSCGAFVPRPVQGYYVEGLRTSFCLAVRGGACSTVNQLTRLHRSVPAQFKMIPKETLGLLRSLNSENRLAATDAKWRREVGDLVREYLSTWTLNEEWVCAPIQ